MHVLLLFSMWFISVDFTIFSSFRVVGNDGIIFISWLNRIPLCMTVYQLIHAYTNSISGAMVANGDTGSAGRCLFDMLFSFSLDICQVVGLLDHMGIFLLVF